MTDMKRTTVSLPDEMVARLERMKQSKEKEYGKITYSELIRRMVEAGLDREENQANA